MYRQSLRASATLRSAAVRAATRPSARLTLSKIGSRSYSSGGESQQKSSSTFFTAASYIAPTLLAVAGYWAFVDRPYKNAKAAKSAAAAVSTPSTPEIVEEKEEEVVFVGDIPEEKDAESSSDFEIETLALIKAAEEALAKEVPAEASALVSEIVDDSQAISGAIADVVESLAEGATQIAEEVTAIAKDTTEGKDKKSESTGTEGAFNAETGEINWDCPCLGGMANGPCGEEFKTAFSCFVYSEDEPKGIDCIEKFSAMQECFKRHPEIYAEEIREAEPFPEEAQLEASNSDESKSEEPKSEVTESASEPTEK